MRPPQEIIIEKRDGGTLAKADIDAFVRGVASGAVTDPQIAAFAMATLLRGMGRDERVALTLAMRDSGDVLRWDHLNGPAVDKHSTGGIGDKVSLPLAPILAACGAYVPMISGRGLGHTGGTLDKLEAIEGYRAQQDRAVFRRCVEEVGCAIVGADQSLAPADRRIYAVRDVTGTVESDALITASILSKKLAAGLDALVMDVKTGSGAFMRATGEARALARALEDAGRGAGLAFDHVISDMNQCLGRSAGNACEVIEACAMLRGERVDARLEELTIDLAARALVLGEIATDRRDGAARARAVLRSGEAAERFSKMMRALGARVDPIAQPEALSATLAPARAPIHGARRGVVAAIDARALGVALVRLKGGRAAVGEAIDPGVGLVEIAGVGDVVSDDHPLFVGLHRGDQHSLAVLEEARNAFTIADEATPGPLFH